MSALNPDTAELLLLFVSCQLDWHLMHKECLCFLTLSPRALQSEVVLRFCCRTRAALLSSNLPSTQIYHKLWNLSFSVSQIQRSLPARRWLRLSLKLNLVLSESLQVFLSQLRDCTPAQQDDITAGSKLLQDLVLKLTGVTTRLAIMENGEGGMETGGQGDAEQPDLPLRRSQLRYKAPLPPLPATVITTSPDWSPAAETLQGVREFYNCNMTRTHRTTYKTSIYIFKKWSYRKCK